MIQPCTPPPNTRSEFPPDVRRYLSRGPEGEQPGPATERLTRGCTVAVCTYKRSDSVLRFLNSLAQHETKPELLLIVDASPDTETEALVESYEPVDQLARRFLYFRVAGALKTLTCSRNFALRQATTDLVVFFDDDVELLPHCLREMERPHRELGDQVMGVGALIQNEPKAPDLLWRVRRWLGMVPHLQPGTYARSGMSVPWNFLDPQTQELVPGDWLRGCAMMWRTAAARELQFNEAFGGHSNSEDLDFSLRALSRGRLVVNGQAQVLHFPNTSGRPDAVKMGYIGMRNAYHIHCHCLSRRRRRDAIWFYYAWGLDTLVRTVALVRPGKRRIRGEFLCGRLQFFRDLLLGRPATRLDLTQPGAKGC